MQKVPESFYSKPGFFEIFRRAERGGKLRSGSTQNKYNY